MDEKTKANMYLFFDTNLGTFATAKNDKKGTIKYTGCALKLAVTSGIKTKVYSVINPNVMMKNIMALRSKKVNLACNRPSVFNNK